MRRQRPIRSVLAGRKMFNGGMIMPLDTPPAMQNTPSGILASSQPLIESVTQEVVAPMSSASASAPVPMAQGGAVQGFFNGGLQSRNQYRKSRSKWEPQIDGIGPGLPGTGLENGGVQNPAWSDTTVGERTRLGPGSSPENLIARYEANPGELTNLMFPYSAGQTGRFSSINRGTSPQKMRPGIIGIPPVDRRGIQLLYEAPTAFLDQLSRGLSNVGASATRALYDFSETFIETIKPKDQNYIALYDQITEVNDLLRRLPDIAGVSKDDLATEISGIAKQAVSDDPNISGANLANIVSEQLRVKYDDPVLEQSEAVAAYDLSQEGGGFSTEKEQADAFLSMEINKLYPNMPDDEVIEIIKAKELNPESSIEELVKISYPVLDKADIRAVYPKATDKQVEIIIKGAKRNPGLSPEQIARLIAGTSDDVGTSDDYHADAPASPASAENAATAADASPAAAWDLSPISAENAATAAAADEYGTTKGAFGDYMSGDEESREGLLMGDLRKRVYDAGNEVAQVMSGKKTSEENERDMKFFIDRFKENAPEYEGASPQEKALVLVDAGLRVMAGQSPNAIRNIADGLKGIGKELAKDAKEKRAYDRQIELSAFKYGMEAVTKEEDRERTLDTTYESTIATGSGSFVLPNGRTENYKAGQLVLVPKSIILNKGVPDNLTLPTYAGTLATANATKAKNLATAARELREELLVKDKQSNIIKKDFLEASDQVILGHEIKALIENSFTLSEDATGITNVGKNLVFKALSATDWRPDFLLGPGTAAEKEKRLVEKFGGREKYNNQMQEVANRLLKRLLGEGSKNVSNVDRDLAQQISGLVKDVATGVYTNPTLLRQRLKRILTMADNDILKGETIMKNIYGEYSTRITPGMPVERRETGGYSERVLKPLAEQSLLARRTSSRTALQQTVFGKISGFTFKDGKYVIDKK